mmetsp:Transcript_62644/g.204442  ORF Transcript_62644/g.204442 Transcript_62644/m.204442 type:complete len:275 (+) Transcript_62644:1058-1882(+)
MLRSPPCSSTMRVEYAMRSPPWISTTTSGGSRWPSRWRSWRWRVPARRRRWLRLGPTRRLGRRAKTRSRWATARRRRSATRRRGARRRRRGARRRWARWRLAKTRRGSRGRRATRALRPNGRVRSFGQRCSRVCGQRWLRVCGQRWPWACVRAWRQWSLRDFMQASSGTADKRHFLLSSGRGNQSRNSLQSQSRDSHLQSRKSMQPKIWKLQPMPLSRTTLRMQAFLNRLGFQKLGSERFGREFLVPSKKQPRSRSSRKGTQGSGRTSGQSYRS